MVFLDSVEAFEDVGEVCGGDSYAVVTDGDLDVFDFFLRLYIYYQR